MDRLQFHRLHLRLTAAVTLSTWILLAWAHFHGGIARHHLLHRADLPAFSNGWSALLLPTLTWFLLSRVRTRVASAAGERGASGLLRSAAAWFAGSGLFGLLFSASFLMGFEGLTSALFFGMLALVLLLPVFRAECLLGFILGMSLAFGGVLPVLIGCILALLAALGHYVIHPILGRLWSLIRSLRPSTKEPVRTSER